jgi:hypothetical protein
MKQGQVVKIYFDPIMKRKIEGEAALVKKLDVHPGPGYETWIVNFVAKPGRKYFSGDQIRKIHIQ